MRLNRFGTCTVLGIGATLLFTSGCASKMGVALDEFSQTYQCPAAQVQLQEHPADVLGVERIDATGCGHQTFYSCQYGRREGGGRDDGANTCTEATRVNYEATDGSVRSGFLGGALVIVNGQRPADPSADARKEAAIASAAHDLPCAPGAIQFISESGQTILQGCGQRVTYQVTAEQFPGAPGGAPPAQTRKFVMTGKVAAQ